MSQATTSDCVAGGRERGVKAAERPAAGHHDRRSRVTPGRVARRPSPTTIRIVGQRLGDSSAQLTLEDRPPSTTSALLSRPPNRRRPTAGENGRARASSRRSYTCSLTMREAGIGRVLVASLHQGIADILPTRLGLLRELAERRRPARGDDRPGAALRGAELPAAGRRRVSDDHRRAPASTPRSGRCSRCRRCSARSIKAAPVWLRSRLLLRLARQLVRSSYHGQPRDLAAAPRHGQRRRARVDLLHRARAGAASAVRFLRGRVHAAAGAVRPRARAPRSSRAAAPASRPACCRVALPNGHDAPAGGARDGAVGARARLLLAARARAASAAAAPRPAAARAAGAILVMPFENVDARRRASSGWAKRRRCC